MNAIEINKNGILIFDYPVKSRKNRFLPRKTGMQETAFQLLISQRFQKISGKLKIQPEFFFSNSQITEIHKKIFLPLDIFLCRTFLKNWASYHITVLEKI
jgi:hypothetical protein